MADNATELVEAKLNTVIDATAVFDGPDLDPQLLQGFVTDIAQAIHTPETIARRYGFASPGAMIAFIRDNREIRKRIKTQRAIWESDDSVENKIRKLAGVSVLEALPSTAAIMVDREAGKTTRIDALKAHARLAGVDGAGGGEGGSKSGGTAPFTVNFMFSGGRTEKITATVVEGKPTAVLELPDEGGEDEPAS